jgi:hypothetical protein
LPDLAKANPFRTNIVRSTYRVLHDGGLMKFLADALATGRALANRTNVIPSCTAHVRFGGKADMAYCSANVRL